MQIETLIDVDRLIVDQGLYSWMFFFQWGRRSYTFQMRVTNAVPTSTNRHHNCLYIYIYIYIYMYIHIYIYKGSLQVDFRVEQCSIR